MSNINIKPESTAERVALWRALHIEIESKPYIVEDKIGLKLLGDNDLWRKRPDMNPIWTANFRASIVARARFIEDYLQGQIPLGVTQYVILGAGLDSFAQRYPDLLKQIKVFEVDQIEPQIWKKQRLVELGFEISENLKFVGVDFEKGWWDELVDASFDLQQAVVVVSTGVTMYLTRDANMNTFRQMTRLAEGSSFITTFILPVDMVEPEYQASFEASMQGAAKSGHPFISLFKPDEIEQLLRQAGFNQVEQISSKYLSKRYFEHREDGFSLSSGEEIIIGKV